jgi:hypothetical protein
MAAQLMSQGGIARVSLKMLAGRARPVSTLVSLLDDMVNLSLAEQTPFRNVPSNLMSYELREKAVAELLGASGANSAV